MLMQSNQTMDSDLDKIFCSTERQVQGQTKEAIHCQDMQTSILATDVSEGHATNIKIP